MLAPLLDAALLSATFLQVDWQDGGGWCNASHLCATSLLPGTVLTLRSWHALQWSEGAVEIQAGCRDKQQLHKTVWGAHSCVHTSMQGASARALRMRRIISALFHSASAGKRAGQSNAAHVQEHTQPGVTCRCVRPCLCSAEA